MFKSYQKLFAGSRMKDKGRFHLLGIQAVNDTGLKSEYGALV